MAESRARPAAREPEVRQVDAEHQQHCAHRGHQQDETLADVTDHALLQRDEAGVEVEIAGDLLADSGLHHVEFGLGLAWRDAGTKAGGGPEVEIARGFRFACRHGVRFAAIRAGGGSRRQSAVGVPSQRRCALQKGRRFLSRGRADPLTGRYGGGPKGVTTARGFKGEATRLKRVGGGLCTEARTATWAEAS
jgi:hypothetical protein